MEISAPTTINIEIYIDPHICNNCGACLNMCSMGVFHRNSDVAFPEKSHLCCSCFKCNEFCPEHAITTRWVVRA